MSKEYYETVDDAISEAKENLRLAQNDAAWIYAQRQMEPNMSLLINKFYYSLFYCLLGILALKTNEKFKKHESAINAFNYYVYSNSYLNTGYVSAISVLKGLREEYDYHNADVDEEKYLMAEKLWLEYYPEMENELVLLLSK